MPDLEPSVLCPVSLADIRAARSRNAGGALRTPLHRLHLDEGTGPPDLEIYLKLESFQPIGCFKVRGAGNAVGEAAERHDLSRGVYTASVGNMALGIAWSAHRMGIPCHVVVPTNAPPNKLAAVEALGAEVVRVSFAEWWRVIVEHRHPGLEGHFIHPVSNAAVIAGNGVLGLEILEDLPDVDAVIAPFGGGGLGCGIASALAELRPEARVWASEVETAAPLVAAFEAGRPQQVDYTATFVEGVGGKSVLLEMWPLVKRLLAGSVVVSLDEVAAAVRLLVEKGRIVAEGAAATTVAAALTGRAGTGKVVCVVSGGNISSERLAKILGGGIPGPAG